MALKNYSDLQAKILVTAKALKDFPEVDVKDFIALAETDVASVIDHYLMHETLATTATDFLVLPEDFLEPRNFTVDGKETVPLSINGGTISKDQVGYYQNGSKYVFVPATGQPRNIVLDYTASITPLSEDNPTNWLLLRFPAVYLHASLLRVYRYLIDESEGAEKASLSDALAVLSQHNKRGQKVGNPLSWRV